MAGLFFKNPADGQWAFLSLVGSMGATGPSGPTGALGANGAMGPTGVQGGIGPTGPQGGAGSAGPVGLIGPTGPQGTAGAQGPQGATGVQGIGGPQGGQGPQGGAGPAGVDHHIQFRVGLASVGGGTNVQGAWTAFSSPYGASPCLCVSMRTSTPGDIYVNCTHTGLTNAGFYPVVYRTNATTCLVDWWAAKMRGTLLSAEEQAADANARAYYYDVSQHVWFVQVPANGGAFSLVEADYWECPEDTQVLRMLNTGGGVVAEFGPGEWSSVQHEYVIDGAF